MNPAQPSNPAQANQTTRITLSEIERMTYADKLGLVESYVTRKRSVEQHLQSKPGLDLLLASIPSALRQQFVGIMVREHDYFYQFFYTASRIRELTDLYPDVKHVITGALLQDSVFRQNYINDYSDLITLISLPGLAQGIVVLLLNDPAQRHSIKINVSAFKVLLNFRIRQVSELVECLLPTPEFKAAVSPNPKSLLTLLEAFPGLQPAIFDFLFANPEIFSSLFNQAIDLVYFVNKFSVSPAQIISWMLSTPQAFFGVVSSVRCLIEFTTSFPDYKEQTLALIFNHPDQLRKLFWSKECIVLFLNQEGFSKQQLQEAIINDPEFLARIAENQEIFLWLLKRFPSEQDRLIKTMLAHERTKHRLFATSYDFVRLMEKLPLSQQKTVMQNLLQQDGVMERLLESEDDLRRIHQVCPEHSGALLRLFTAKVVAEPFNFMRISSLRLTSLASLSPIFRRVFSNKTYGELLEIARSYQHDLSRAELCKNVYSLFSGRRDPSSANYGLSNDMIANIVVKTRNPAEHSERQAYAIIQQELHRLQTIVTLRRPRA